MLGLVGMQLSQRSDQHLCQPHLVVHHCHHQKVHCLGQHSRVDCWGSADFFGLALPQACSLMTIPRLLLMMMLPSADSDCCGSGALVPLLSLLDLSALPPSQKKKRQAWSASAKRTGNVEKTVGDLTIACCCCFLLKQEVEFAMLVVVVVVLVSYSSGHQIPPCCLLHPELSPLCASSRGSSSLSLPLTHLRLRAQALIPSCLPRAALRLLLLPCLSGEWWAERRLCRLWQTSWTALSSTNPRGLQVPPA